MKLKKNYFKPNKQVCNPTNQSIYKREKDEHIKHPDCRSKKFISRKQFFQITEVGHDIDLLFSPIFSLIGPFETQKA